MADLHFPLTIAPGINTDDTPFAAGGQWVDGSNMRPWRGGMEALGRSIDYGISTPPTGIVRKVHVWTKNDGTELVVCGTDSKLYASVLSGITTWSDITPAGFTAGSAASPLSWGFENYGENLIACARRHGAAGGASTVKMYQWELDTGTAATQVTNSPARSSDILVTAERQILALGCNEVTSGTFNPRCIRGSDIEVITDWSPSAADSSFEYILEDSGEIVTGRRMGGYIAVWTEDNIHLGQYVGNGTQVYRFDKIADSAGLYSRNVLATSNGSAFWLGNDLQFRYWTLGGEPVVVPCPLLRGAFDNPETGSSSQVSEQGQGKMFMEYIQGRGEFWFFYPDYSDNIAVRDYPTRGIGYNVAEGKWFKIGNARSAMKARQKPYSGVYAFDESGSFYLDDVQGFQGGQAAWSLTSGDIAVSDGLKRMVFQEIGQSGDITMTIKSKDYPNGSYTTVATETLTTSTEKVNFMGEGRLLNITLSGSAATSGIPCRLGKIVVKASVAGTQ